MGTTRDALNAGSMAFRWIVAIEGYPYLLTDAKPEQAQASWAGTDWQFIDESPFVNALGGLFVELDASQRMHPWEPFQRGGRCMLRVVQTTPADTFGVDTHKRNAGLETELTATVDREATTIPVKSTAGWPSAGTLFIGTECIVYTGTTSNSFTGCTRGIFSPFATGAGGLRFAQHHRVGSIGDGPKLNPLVTSVRRQWKGAWVGLWMCRIINDVLDLRSEAELVYAGRLVSVVDDPATLSTCVELKHVLDVLAETTVVRDEWTARATGGVYLDSGTQLYWTEYTGSGSPQSAPNLIAVPSGATGTDQLNEGIYTQDELYLRLNLWLANSGLDGDYDIGPGPDPASGNEERVKIRWNIPGSGTVWWKFTAPYYVLDYFGFKRDYSNAQHGKRLSDNDSADEWHHFVASEPAPRAIFGVGETDTAVRIITRLTGETGVLVDNYARFPQGIKDAADTYDASHNAGVTSEWYVVAPDGDAPRLATWRDTFGVPFLEIAGTLDNLGRARLGGTNLAPAGVDIPMRQVHILSGTLAELVPQFLMSTGTDGYNGTYDVLPFGLGLGIPGELCARLVDSLASVPGSDGQQLVVIDEPTKFAELFHGELVLRGAFPRWKFGSLELATWQTPTADAAAATLEEGNKAAPLGTRDEHRSASIESDQFAKPIIKLDYNRDASSINDDYQTTLTLEDAAAIDDAGGEGAPVTIKLRNTYAQYATQGAAIEALAPLLLTRMPLVARPMRMTTRSIDQRLWLSLSVGDTVLVQDWFARDPDTGRRGVTTRTGLVLRHRWNPGGLQPGTSTANPMGGEVDIMLTDIDRLSWYVPSALVDETQTNAGYDSGTQVLTCHAHKYSESSEPADATHMTLGSKIRIVEVDPADASSPLAWEREVAWQSGNTITHDGGPLTGWDASKAYRVVWQDYRDATATQQAYAYQADDADGMIDDTSAPRTYALKAGDVNTTAASASDPVELVPAAAYGDGVGRDVGHEMALARLANGLLDRKLAHSSPFLADQALYGGDVEGAWKLVLARPLWLTVENTSAGVKRLLDCAPFFHSTDDGETASVRVSLCREAPSGDDFNDVDRGVCTSITWHTTSTTWAVGAVNSLAFATIKRTSGFVWLLVEVNEYAETYGLAHCQEGARSLT